MGEAEARATLVKIGDEGLTIADPKADVRGRKVVDRDGHELGKVEDLLIDEPDHKVRFLQVGAGGFLGLGERHFLIPVDAVTKVDADEVHVDQTTERVVAAPAYDPKVVPEPSYWDELYGYYGHAPYWAPGYVYPGYPFVL